jgi:hypothetical protein
MFAPDGVKVVGRITRPSFTLIVLGVTLKPGRSVTSITLLTSSSAEARPDPVDQHDRQMLSMSVTRPHARACTLEPSGEDV